MHQSRRADCRRDRRDVCFIVRDNGGAGARLDLFDGPQPIPWWNAKERFDKAIVVPNLYVEATCQSHCLPDGLFVVGTLHNVGGPQNVTSASDVVDAI